MANSFPTTTPHLNSFGLAIRSTPSKGRGIYATRPIPAGTLIEVSPVLLFESKEYADHARFTIIDHYSFVWGDGRMALPLGIGSLFNHSDSPNVTWTKSKSTMSIEYRTTRKVEPGEELYIFYGHKLWFQDVDANAETDTDTDDNTQAISHLGGAELMEDPLGGILLEDH